MKYLIFILLILCIAFLYFYYNRKLELIKKQLILTRNQYSLSKNKNHSKSKPENILVSFSIPKYKNATLKAKSYIYLSPLINSHILNCIDINTEVAILDCAELNNETWFYINIPNRNNINTRGWINSKDISIFYSNSSSIVN